MNFALVASFLPSWFIDLGFQQKHLIGFGFLVLFPLFFFVSMYMVLSQLIFSEIFLVSIS